MAAARRCKFHDRSCITSCSVARLIKQLLVVGRKSLEAACLSRASCAAQRLCIVAEWQHSTVLATSVVNRLHRTNDTRKRNFPCYGAF